MEVKKTEPSTLAKVSIELNDFEMEMVKVNVYNLRTKLMTQYSVHEMLLWFTLCLFLQQITSFSNLEVNLKL